MFIVTTGASKQQVKAGRGRISRAEAKVQDGRQVQGQVRQRSVIQRWSKGSRQAQGQAEWSGTGSGQAKVKNQEDEKKRQKKHEQRQMLDDLNKQDKLAQTDRQKTQV